MLITRKALKVSDPSKLCLVIPLENGIKIQYPVVNTAEAIAKYTDFLKLNADPSIHSEDVNLVESDTFSRLLKSPTSVSTSSLKM